LDLLQRAARARPDDLPRWRLLSEAAVAAGRPDVALDACQEALRLQPALAWACRLRAEVLLGLGRAAEAVAALDPVRDALAGDSAGAELYVQALAESKVLPQVEPFLRRAADGPRPVPVLLGGARALLAAGRPDLASRWAEEAARHAPDDKAARRLLADSLRAWAEQDGAPAWDRERVRAAIDAYEWLRQREPEDLAVLNNIAWLQLKGLGQSDLAFRTLAPLRAKESAADLSPEMLETLAAVYLGRGQAEPAVRLLERAARSSRPRASYLVHLALAYQQLGRRDDARRCLVRAASLPRSTREDANLKQAIQRFD
jgi:tetratricopeptide (TPR) repeat protein